MDKNSEYQLDEIKNISIINLVEKLGYTPIKKGNLFNLKEHDSLVLYPETNSFYQFSTGDGGSVIDLYMKFTDSSLAETIKSLKDFSNITDDNFRYQKDNKIEKIKEKRFVLPIKSEGKYNKLYAYLCKTRGVESSVISFALKEKYIYQDEKNNVVFVGYNKDKQPVNATKRSTLTGCSFKGDVFGSDKSVGFFINNKSPNLYVTESAIDSFSIMTMNHLQNKNYKDNNYLSLGGATNIKALEYTLNSYPKIQNIAIALDNDTTGVEQKNKILKLIKEKYPDKKIYISTPKSKDFNQDLVNFKQNTKTITKEKSLDSCIEMTI